jgi:hypothetical protein
MTNITKICTECGLEKSIHQFARDGYGKKGQPRYRPNCKDCRNAKRRVNYQEDETDSDKPEVKFDDLVYGLIELGRYDLDRIKSIKVREFINKTNSQEYLRDHNYEEIVEAAIKKMHDMGYCHPETLEFGAGTYLVVGDSHGKHTRTAMFKMLKNVCDVIGVDEIFHIGHILDDDNDVSYRWKYFDNVNILACIEELTSLQGNIDYEEDQYSKGKVKAPYNFSVARKQILLGNLILQNQNLITDYTKTYIKNLDQQIYNDSVIANSHRHEMFSRNTYGGVQFVGSPGCICEKHIVKTIKQIDYTSGYQVKMAMPKGFKKYRRMQDMYNFWEQGMFIVHVDVDGDFSIVPCRIKKVGVKYVTSYFDKIITEVGVEEPDVKIFMNSDIHCDRHDIKVLDIQDSIVKDYNPDIYFNLGDMQNNSALNHHEMGRGYPIEKAIVEETSSLHYILKKTSDWADEKYLIYGNHERFSKDFWRKYPQLRGLFESLLTSATEQYGFQMVDHLNISQLGDATFVHGDMRLFNQTGIALEKFAKTYKNNVVMGHVHYTAIRFGCYSLGLTGLLDQEYNEVNGSNWVHGFGTCNIYKGVSFISNYSIVNDKTHVNNNKYTVGDNRDWVTPSYKFSVNFDFDDNTKGSKKIEPTVHRVSTQSQEAIVDRLNSILYDRITRKR